MVQNYAYMAERIWLDFFVVKRYLIMLVITSISRVERKTMVTQTYFLKPLFRGNLYPFVNNANLGAIAHTSNGT